MVAYMHIHFGFWLETLIPDLCQEVRPHQNGAAPANSIFPHPDLHVLIIPTPTKIGRHSTKPRTKIWTQNQVPPALSPPPFCEVSASEGTFPRCF